MSKPVPQPLFILGSPRSFTSLICAMLGQHPQAYGVPELNLFVADTLGQMWEWMIKNRHMGLGLHGLLRTVAHLYTGEQTLQSVHSSLRWMLSRISSNTTDVYWELCEKVAPLQIIDKSPIYSFKPAFLNRIEQAFPEAYYIHLVRHPRTQGESMLKLNEGAIGLALLSYDYSTAPPTLDPQVLWHTMQLNIMAFLEHIPPSRRMLLRGEDVLNDPFAHLTKICQWLGLSTEEAAIQAMLHPEDAFFAFPGPWGANVGVDINFLRSPVFRPKQIRPSTMKGSLPWRPDGKGFHEDVIALAENLGYSDVQVEPPQDQPHKTDGQDSSKPTRQDRQPRHAPQAEAMDVSWTCTPQEELDQRRSELQYHQHCLQIMLELTESEVKELPQKVSPDDGWASPDTTPPTEDRKPALPHRRGLTELFETIPRFELHLGISTTFGTQEEIDQRRKELLFRIDWMQAMFDLTQKELAALPPSEETARGAANVRRAAARPSTVTVEYRTPVMRLADPAPKHGLRREQFHKVCENGLGDRHNSYAHSMAWFKDRLYVGTTRVNLCLIRKALPVQIDVWPVDCSAPIGSPEFERTQARAEIWRYEPRVDCWERVSQAPMVDDGESGEMSRELGYRRMEVFQGKSDRTPALYVSTWSRSKSPGMLLLRSEDGEMFTPVSQPGLVGLNITSIRSLVAFQGRLFAAPTGGTGTRANISEIPIIYESTDPASGEWWPCNEPGFGDMGNRTVFELFAYEDYLYAGTANNNGYQVWRTRAEGRPPYKWEQVVREGAGRGSLNQFAVSMIPFNNAIYVGSGIQNGGYDCINKIGPAGAELIRINRDGSWDLLVGDERKTSDGLKKPLSGLQAGFGNFFNGYIWKMAVHDDWLYAGTMNWSIILRYYEGEGKSEKTRQLLEKIGVENLISQQGGFHLWRSKDGENWLPVCRQGFGNFYNYGVRNLVSTSHGLFVGTANPFGPRVAVRKDGLWVYADNPNGGMEVWLGKRENEAAVKER